MNDILTISEHQEIYVAQKRDVINNTISYEDREVLFDIKFIDKKDNERYIISHNGKNRIKANSIVGSISLKTGLTIEILPKFAKDNLDEESIKKHRKMLLNILRVSNEKNFISSSSQSSKVLADEMPLLHYVIELFSLELLHTLRTGIYATYNKKIENSSHVRGNILISKTLQNNIIDKSKVYISYNKHSSNNLLMQIFRTLAKMLLNDKNLSYKAKQTLHEVYLLLDGVDIISLKKQDFKSIIFNRLNEKFETLFTQAEFIFNKYMPFSSHINSSPFWVILFDMNYLFEKFCAYLFRKSDLEIEEQSITKCFENHKYSVSAKPDFIVKANQNLFDKKIINVIDAKWKLLSNDKSLYGLDSQNFWQLFSYMNLLNHDEEVHGYFIVPKNSNSSNDEIIFQPIKEGNKSITILSIDFSLNFEELIEKYRFKIVNNTLKLDIKVIEKIILKEEIVIVEPLEEVNEQIKIIEEKFQFNLESFIEELDFLNKNRNLKNKISPSKKDDKFKNLFYMKDKYETTSKIFKSAVKENINRNAWSFEDLEISNIPVNIIRLKNVSEVSFKNNKIIVIPKELFKLNKLKFLNLSKNNIIKIPNEIKKLKNLLVLSIYDNKNIDISSILEIKSLKELRIDKNIIENNIEVISKLSLKNIKIVDSDNNDLLESINSFKSRNKNNIGEFEELNINSCDENKVMINFNKNNIEKFYSNNYESIIFLAKIQNLADEYKIILFYREYQHTQDKYEVQKILKNNSSKDLKLLFDTPVKKIIDLFKSDKFKEILLKYNSWIKGFVYCTNNSFLFKIKAIIAKYSSNQELITRLSDETNENKIIFSILANLNKNEKHEYIVNADILEKIFFNSIDNSDCKIAIAILKRKELQYSLFRDILEHCQDRIDLSQFKNNEYFDKDILAFIKEKILVVEPIVKDEENPNYFVNITLEKYLNMDDNKKIKFINNNLIDENLLKDIIYMERNEKVILEILNKKINLRFVTLIYLLNTENKNIFDAVDDLIPLSQDYIADSFSDELDINFEDINIEILFGYAMTKTIEFQIIREKISELTNDLGILNELSKNIDDEKVLENIMFKNSNKIFRDKNNIKFSNNKMFSMEILDRISKYDKYYRFGDKSCLIIKLAGNYSLTDETKEYLFEKYQEDETLLYQLAKNKNNWKLKEKIERALSLIYREDEKHCEPLLPSYGGINTINFDVLSER